MMRDGVSYLLSDSATGVVILLYVKRRTNETKTAGA